MVLEKSQDVKHRFCLEQRTVYYCTILVGEEEGDWDRDRNKREIGETVDHIFSGGAQDRISFQ